MFEFERIRAFFLYEYVGLNEKENKFSNWLGVYEFPIALYCRSYAAQCLDHGTSYIYILSEDVHGHMSSILSYSAV